MRTTIVRNIFISVGVLFALTGLLSADKPQPTIITFDAPGAGTGPFEMQLPRATPTPRPRPTPPFLGPDLTR